MIQKAVDCSYWFSHQLLHFLEWVQASLLLSVFGILKQKMPKSNCSWEIHRFRISSKGQCFLPVQPITQFTQAEIYLLPFRFIGRLLSPINRRPLEQGYSLPPGEGQTRKKFKTKMKIREWKAGRMGRAAKHRKRVLFIWHREEGEFQYYT